MRKRTTIAMLILAGMLGLGLSTRGAAPATEREVEILRQILERRRLLLEHEVTRLSAGVIGTEAYVEAHADWTNARVCLARELDDQGEEREALTEHLRIRREHLDRVIARRGVDLGVQDRLEAEIAVLKYELRLERVGQDQD